MCYSTIREMKGYGFPPVEAMACGIPVITSNCSSLPEVVRDAALMIDPYRPFDIVLALEILLSDERVYDEYAQNGIKRAQELYRSTQKIIDYYSHFQVDQSQIISKMKSQNKKSHF